jgi:hypothetical protein
MELLLTRIAKRKAYTIGKLSMVETINDEYSTGTKETYLCDTLEPTWRDYQNGDRKIKGHSAIPEGHYAVVISYSPKFKKWLPLLLGGPEFNKQWQGIRIHAGNKPEDTQGCILVGENKVVGRLLNSCNCLYDLKQKMVEAKGRGESIWLTIK